MDALSVVALGMAKKAMSAGSGGKKYYLHIIDFKADPATALTSNLLKYYNAIGLFIDDDPWEDVSTATKVFEKMMSKMGNVDWALPLIIQSKGSSFVSNVAYYDGIIEYKTSYTEPRLQVNTFDKNTGEHSGSRYSIYISDLNSLVTIEL